MTSHEYISVVGHSHHISNPFDSVCPAYHMEYNHMDMGKNPVEKQGSYSSE